MKEILAPSYYTEFSCIGPTCEDTCCAGWSVTIDERTFKKYKKLRSSATKLQIEKAIKRNRNNPSFFDYGSIKLNGKGACPLLTDGGLCSIHANLGGDSLSHTCATYPRISNEVEQVLEQSLTLSCPEAARLALLNKDGIDFIQTEEDSTQWDTFTNKNENPSLWPLRIASIRLLQNRSTTIENRLITLGLFLQKVESEHNLTSESFEQLLNQYEKRLATQEFIAQLEHLPRNNNFQLKVLALLTNNRSGITNKRFLTCATAAIKGLQIDQDLSNDEKIAIYTSAANSEYKEFIAQHEYILENYLVNHVFKELFPFDEKTFIQSYQKIVIYYILIKFHLIGMAKFHGTLTTDHAITLIQSFVRTTEHNYGYAKAALDFLEEEDLTTIGHLVTLIQH